MDVSVTPAMAWSQRQETVETDPSKSRLSPKTGATPSDQLPGTDALGPNSEACAPVQTFDEVEMTFWKLTMSEPDGHAGGGVEPGRGHEVVLGGAGQSLGAEEGDEGRVALVEAGAADEVIRGIELPVAIAVAPDVHVHELRRDRAQQVDVHAAEQ